LQYDPLRIYSAISACHPAAVPAACYRQLLQEAFQDQSYDQHLHIDLIAPQALFMLSRHVKDSGEQDHIANIEPLALQALVHPGTDF
jgi:hypothetical protein